MGWGLAGYSEAPVVADIGEPDEQREACHLERREQDLKAGGFEPDLLNPCSFELCGSASEHGLAAVYGVVFALQRLQSFEGEGAFSLVEFCHVLQDLYCFCIFPAVE